MNETKTPLKLLLVALIGISLSACSDVELSPTSKPTPPPASTALAGFIHTDIGVSEIAGSSDVVINLDKLATKDGSITLTVASSNLNSFTTVPAVNNNQITLSVTKGQAAAVFEFIPTDNNLHTENQSIDFTITAVSDGFGIDSKKTLRLTILENDPAILAGFMSASSSLLENRLEEFTVPIGFSLQTPGEGFIEISLGAASGYGVYFTTEPEAVAGKIGLKVSAGMSFVPLTFKPIDNATINGHHEIELSIATVSGVVEKGALMNHRLILTDDELAGKPKGYQIASGNGWSVKRTYEYNEQGLLSKVLWEQNTPGHQSGSYAYSYNEAGQLVEMTESFNYKTYYTLENDRIIKSEKYRDGILVAYSTYGYDPAGNIGETGLFYRQETGELKMELLLVYLYFDNGNIYKQITYTPIDGSDEYALVSTKTYDNYLPQYNPFTMVEILPNLDTQVNLPGSYREETNGKDFRYQLTYEFDEGGRPLKRVASSTTGSETAYYEYY